MNPALQIFGLLLSAAAALIGALVLYTLKTMSKRLDSQESRMNAIETEQKFLAGRKIDCQQEFVEVGAFLRETGYTRKQLDQTLTGLAGLSGKLEVVNQLPQIAGQIAAQTVKEMVRIFEKEKAHG